MQRPAAGRAGEPVGRVTQAGTGPGILRGDGTHAGEGQAGRGCATGKLANQPITM